MEEQNPPHLGIDYVVGAEKKLHEIVSEPEVLPLLQGMVKAGARAAALLTAEGEPLWSHGEIAPAGETLFAISLPLTLEGEPIGTVRVQGERQEERALSHLAGFLQLAIATILTNNLKRMLTTELHTTVVNQSYDELLTANRELADSEAKYRLLASQLEIKVEERTAALRRLHAQLLIQEKMAAVGQLAAGLAHEINNPLGFIKSNLTTLQKYLDRFTETIAFYREILARLPLAEENAAAIAQQWRTVKLEAILADLPDLLLQTRTGCERIQQIVADLKGFSHLDEATEAAVDLNQELDQTLKVLQIPADARIEKNYTPLPAYLCNPAQMALAFYNIIRNAIQAQPLGLVLRLSSEVDKGAIRVTFADNGPGMPPEIASRVFEPFFTTKEVGSGTGLGLTTAYETITGLGGTIAVHSQPGQGTEFVINLPLKGA